MWTEILFLNQMRISCSHPHCLESGSWSKSIRVSKIILWNIAGRVFRCRLSGFWFANKMIGGILGNIRVCQKNFFLEFPSDGCPIIHWLSVGYPLVIQKSIGYPFYALHHKFHEECVAVLIGLYKKNGAVSHVRINFLFVCVGRLWSSVSVGSQMTF